MEHLLDWIAGPAALLDAGGCVVASNPAGRGLLKAAGGAALATAAVDRATTDLFAMPVGRDGSDRPVILVMPRTIEAETLTAVVRVAMIARLTPRETEVLAELMVGRGNKAIATRLSCALRTVEAHVTRLMTKVGVANRLELVCRCWRGFDLPAENRDAENRVVDDRNFAKSEPRAKGRDMRSKADRPRIRTT